MIIVIVIMMMMMMIVIVIMMKIIVIMIIINIIVTIPIPNMQVSDTRDCAQQHSFDVSLDHATQQQKPQS